MVSKKSESLPQQEMGSIKSQGVAATRNGKQKKGGGAAAARIGKYKKLGRCCNEKWSVKNAGALPQREPGSIKCRGAAATRNR